MYQSGFSSQFSGCDANETFCCLYVNKLRKIIQAHHHKAPCCVPIEIWTETLSIKQRTGQVVSGEIVERKSSSRQVVRSASEPNIAQDKAENLLLGKSGKIRIQVPSVFHYGPTIRLLFRPGLRGECRFWGWSELMGTQMGLLDLATADPGSEDHFSTLEVFI